MGTKFAMMIIALLSFGAGAASTSYRQEKSDMEAVQAASMTVMKPGKQFYDRILPGELAEGHR